jgi:hypothetical protein
MVAFEKAVLSALGAFAASSTGRFLVQLLILIALCVIGGLALWDRYKAMQHRRGQETAEDYDMALDAKDALNAGLSSRVASLEKEMGLARERETALVKRIDTMRARHEAEMEDVCRTFEKRIAALEARLIDFECMKAPTCKARLRPSRETE